MPLIYELAASVLSTDGLWESERQIGKQIFVPVPCTLSEDFFKDL